METRHRSGAPSASSRSTAGAGPEVAPPDGGKPASPPRRRAAKATAYQQQALLRVSRTFALTIPQLPPPLREVIGNAYLLCRIADTIEDEPTLSGPGAAGLLGEFAGAVAGRVPAERFAARLAPLLSEATTAGERDLVANAPLVLRITHRFRPAERTAIERCISVMTAGMGQFGGGTPDGLDTLDDLERYTYCVAGVVGEMITELMCAYSPGIASRRDRLFPLSRRFGCGLQLVNILKDVREDHRRGVCWLPRAAFASDVDLAVPHSRNQAAFAEGLNTLVAVARNHLDAALEYTMLIPAHEAGIRRFLLWTLGLAVLTLRRIHANPRFESSGEVKVTRPAVRTMALVTAAAARRDTVLRWLFRRACAPLPAQVP